MMAEQSLVCFIPNVICKVIVLPWKPFLIKEQLQLLPSDKGDLLVCWQRTALAQWIFICWNAHHELLRQNSTRWFLLEEWDSTPWPQRARVRQFNNNALSQNMYRMPLLFNALNSNIILFHSHYVWQTTVVSIMRKREFRGLSMLI